MTAQPAGSPTHCAVVHGPGYVPGEHGGDITLYRSLTSTARFWLCADDVVNALGRGIQLEPVDSKES